MIGFALVLGLVAPSAALPSANALPTATGVGRTLVVAPWGSDYDTDGHSTFTPSASRPWATLTMAIRRAKPGDTIVLRGGTYREVAGWGARPARPDARITVEPWPGERAVLKGVLQLDGADYWTLRGLTIVADPQRSRGQFVVKFDGGTGWELLDSEVTGSTGVSNVMVTSDRFGPPADYRIAGNCIHGNRSTGRARMNYHNIYLMPGPAAGPGVIERNLVFDAPNGSNIKAAGPSPARPTGNVVIRYNTLATASAGISLAYGSNRISTYRNLIGPSGRGDLPFDAAVRGNHVNGVGNVVRQTAVWKYRNTVKSTDDSSRPIRARGVVRLNPGFDRVGTCSGYRPTARAAQAYGRYA